MEQQLACRVCGNDGDENGLCEACAQVESQWHNACLKCGLSCPLQYCLSCHLAYKANQKCQICSKPCKKKWCAECFHSRLRRCVKCTAICDARDFFCKRCYNTPEQCEACGGKKRPGNPFCLACKQAEWTQCKMCNTPTPLLNDVCLNCCRLREMSGV